MNRGITQKQYLGLVPPTEEDARSSQMRILDALKEKGITASFTLPALQKLYPICDEADYNITVSLAWNGSIWQVVDLEAGDTAAEHYGYAADLGSTTVVVRLVNCSDGTVLAETGSVLRLFIPVRRARRPRRIPSGERDGISHEGMCLLRAGKIQLPGR